MPDDAVFNTPAPAENTPETPGATQTPVPSAGVTQEQLDAKFAPIEKSLGEMSNFFTKLEQQATTTPAGPVTPPTDKDWATDFYEKPQETVQAEIAAQAAPILQQNAAFSAKVLMDKHQVDFDTEFGAGAWAEEIEPVLAPIVADAIKNYPTSLSNPTAVQNAVNTIKGDKFAALAARASKLSDAAGEPNKELEKVVAEQIAVQMTGGMRRAPNAAEEKLDDDDSQEFLKEIFRQTGEKRDPARLAKLMNSGPYIEDWQGATKEDK